MIGNIKIIFFGTPRFGAIILEILAKSKFKPVAVVTEPDKPAGRKRILTPPAVKSLIMEHGTWNIPILQPEKLDSGFRFQVSSFKPDLMIVAAYGKILPKEILGIPRHGSLNIHPSLLPKYRGASPIQATILNGDTEGGVTIILMDEKIDHGSIIANLRFKILDLRITYKELSEELAKLGGKLLIETLPRWLAGKIKPIPQDDSKATYCWRIKKEGGKINWQNSAEEIERMTRAFWPWPSAWTILTSKHFNILTKKQLKIVKARPVTGYKLQVTSYKPGQVFLTKNKELAVACGKNALILEELQLEGKKIMTAQEFLNGHPEIVGAILE